VLATPIYARTVIAQDLNEGFSDSQLGGIASLLVEKAGVSK
jgi:hypothetical protein